MAGPMLVINGGEKPFDGAQTRSLRISPAWRESSKNFRVSVEVKINIAARLRAPRQYRDLDLTGRRGSFTRSSLLCLYKPDSQTSCNSAILASHVCVPLGMLVASMEFDR